MSHVMRHISRVTCHVSQVKYNIKKIKESGEAIWCRVCYQRGTVSRIFFTNFNLGSFLKPTTLASLMQQPVCQLLQTLPSNPVLQ